MDNEIESIADIANLLRERDQRPYLSQLSDSDYKKADSKSYQHYQNFLDSKLLSDKYHSKIQSSKIGNSKVIEEYKDRQNKILYFQPQYLRNELFSSQLQSNIYSQMSPLADAQRRKNKQLQLPVEPIQQLEQQSPLYFRLTLLQIKDKISGKNIDQQVVWVTYHSQKKRLRTSTPTQFSINDDFQLYFEWSEGVAVEPSQNIVQLLAEQQVSLSHKLVNFFYSKSNKTMFSYSIEFSRIPFYNRLRLHAEFRFQGLYKQIKLLDQNYQLFAQGQIRGAVLYQFDLVVDLAQYKNSYWCQLSNTQNKKSTAEIKLQSGKYALESQDKQYEGLIEVLIQEDEQMLQ